MALVQQFQALSQRDLQDIKNELDIQQSDFRKLIASSQSGLYEKTTELESQNRALRADVELFNLQQFGALQKTNVGLASLKDQYETESEERELRFNKELQDFKLHQERQNIDFNNRIGQIKEQKSKSDLKISTNLEELGLSREKAKSDEKYNEEVFRAQQQGLRADLGYYEDLGESFDRSQSILDDRIGLVEDIRDLDLEANQVTGDFQRSKLRGSVFQSQNYLAQERAVRQMFGQGRGEIFQAADLDRSSQKFSQQIEGITTAIKVNKIQREKIYKQAADRKLGIQSQKESLTRSQLRLKNSVKKTKLQLKKNNALRNKQKRDFGFALRGISIKEDYQKGMQKISGVTYSRQMSYAQGVKSIADKSLALNKRLSKDLNILKKTSGERSYVRARNEMVRAFNQDRRVAQIKHNRDVADKRQQAATTLRQKADYSMMLKQVQEAMDKHSETFKDYGSDAEGAGYPEMGGKYPEMGGKYPGS